MMSNHHRMGKGGVRSIKKGGPGAHEIRCIQCSILSRWTLITVLASSLVTKAADKMTKSSSVLLAGLAFVAISAFFLPGSDGLSCFTCKWFSDGDDDRCLNVKIDGEDSLMTELGLDQECQEDQDVCRVLHSGRQREGY